jgi:hypothetical protein
MTAHEIADTLAGITGDRPTVLPDTPRPPDMDSQQRRIAAAPAHATAQKAVALLTVLGNQLDTLRTRLDTSRADEVDDCLEDLSQTRQAIGRIKKRLDALSLARGKAA